MEASFQQGKNNGRLAMTGRTLYHDTLKLCGSHAIQLPTHMSAESINDPTIVGD